jgi:hypothetical protein
MPFEISFLAKGKVAFGTLEHFFLGMASHVIKQLIQVIKRSSTDMVTIIGNINILFI